MRRDWREVEVHVGFGTLEIVGGDKDGVAG
jgi:hypothetical protein